MKSAELVNFMPLMFVTGTIYVMVFWLESMFIDLYGIADGLPLYETAVWLMVVFGIGGGLVSFYLSDRYSHYYLMTIGTLILEMTLFLTLVALFMGKVYVAYIAAALWGFVFIYFNCLLTIVFSHDLSG